MVINTGDGLVYDVATTEETAELYSLSAGFDSRLNCITRGQEDTITQIDTLRNEITFIKEKLNRIIEMYGIVQLRCDDNMGMLHVDLSNQGDLSELYPRDIENIKIQCTSSNYYPRKNYKINFWHDSSDYEEDMLLLKGLRPAKTVAHLDRDEEHGYITDISELKNMLKDQVS